MSKKRSKKIKDSIKEDPTIKEDNHQLEDRIIPITRTYVDILIMT